MITPIDSSWPAGSLPRSACRGSSPHGCCRQLQDHGHHHSHTLQPTGRKITSCEGAAHNSWVVSATLTASGSSERVSIAWTCGILSLSGSFSVRRPGLPSVSQPMTPQLLSRPHSRWLSCQSSGYNLLVDCLPFQILTFIYIKT